MRSALNPKFHCFTDTSLIPAYSTNTRETSTTHVSLFLILNRYPAVLDQWKPWELICLVSNDTSLVRPLLPSDLVRVHFTRFSEFRWFNGTIEYSSKMLQNSEQLLQIFSTASSSTKSACHLVKRISFLQEIKTCAMAEEERSEAGRLSAGSKSAHLSCRMATQERGQISAQILITLPERKGKSSESMLDTHRFCDLRSAARRKTNQMYNMIYLKEGLFSGYS